MRALAGAAALLLAALRSCSAGHPCEQEVTAACPDRPGEEVAACLKDKSQHDTPTAISSECTDFIALHTACAHEIGSICDEAYFTDDTIPCLTQWTDASQLSERCAGVVKWAVPQNDDDEGEGPTDELGMSEKDYEEKKEWQRKRKEARGDAIERMKMKEADRKKEEDRVALELLKREDPEAYAQMLEQEAEEKRQQAEMKKRERMMAAAYERRKREEQGVKDEDAEQEPKKPKKKKTTTGPAAKSKPAGSWMPALAGLIVIGALCGFGVYAVSLKSEAKGRKAPRKPKKK